MIGATLVTPLALEGVSLTCHGCHRVSPSAVMPTFPIVNLVVARSCNTSDGELTKPENIRRASEGHEK